MQQRADEPPNAPRPGHRLGDRLVAAALFGHRLQNLAQFNGAKAVFICKQKSDSFRPVVCCAMRAFRQYICFAFMAKFRARVPLEMSCVSAVLLVS